MYHFDKSCWHGTCTKCPNTSPLRPLVELYGILKKQQRGDRDSFVSWNIAIFCPTSTRDCVFLNARHMLCESISSASGPQWCPAGLWAWASTSSNLLSVMMAGGFRQVFEKQKDIFNSNFRTSQNLEICAASGTSGSFFFQNSSVQGIVCSSGCWNQFGCTSYQQEHMFMRGRGDADSARSSR